MDVLGFLGVLLGLGILIYLKCFRKLNVLLAAAVSVLIIILFNRLPVWETMTEAFAGSIGSWIEDFIIIFTLGALLGSSLQSTGCAQSIGETLTKKLGVKYVGVIIHFLSFLLVFAGVDAVVALLSIAPISIAMVRQANLPRRFAIACFLGGGCSYAFGLPGSASVNNLIPIDTLGTTTLAAWLPGLLGSLVTVAFVLLYQLYLEKRFRRKGQGFDLTQEEVTRDFGCRDPSTLCPAWVGFASLLIVVLSSVLLGGTNLIAPKAAVSGGLALATIFNLVFGRKYLQGSAMSVLESGAAEGIVCSILTGAMLGYVAVIQRTQSFMSFAAWASGISLPPLLSAAFTIYVMNIILANSPGSLSIYMSNFSGQMLSAGVDPAILHRVVTMSAASFAAQMPHNPSSVVLTNTYKNSYLSSFPDIAVICILGPMVGTLAAIGFAALGIV